MLPNLKCSLRELSSWSTKALDVVAKKRVLKSFSWGVSQKLLQKWSPCSMRFQKHSSTGEEVRSISRIHARTCGAVETGHLHIYHFTQHLWLNLHVVHYVQSQLMLYYRKLQRNPKTLSNRHLKQQVKSRVSKCSTTYRERAS